MTRPSMLSEALRLVPLSPDELATELRVTRTDFDQYWAEEESLPWRVQMTLSQLLHRVADRTEQPERARELAATIESQVKSAYTRAYHERVVPLIRSAGVDPGASQRALTELLVEFCGPELLEHVPAAIGTPNH
jgi:hypothetical protein